MRPLGLYDPLRRTVGAALAVSLTMAQLSPAFAAPPEGATGEYKDYFRSLTRDGKPLGWCCNESDCREVPTRQVGDTWYAFISRQTFGEKSGAPDAWIPVPQEVFVTPTHVTKRPIRAVACWIDKKLRCFDPRPDVS
jgi:hypothetical protein